MAHDSADRAGMEATASCAGVGPTGSATGSDWRHMSDGCEEQVINFGV